MSGPIMVRRVVAEGVSRLRLKRPRTIALYAVTGTQISNPPWPVLESNRSS